MKVDQLKRLPAMEAAKEIINRHFPDCEGTLLAGSVVRGQGSSTSDLDIVVFDQRLPASYRESLLELGWPVELFCHNLQSYRAFLNVIVKGQGHVYQE